MCHSRSLVLPHLFVCGVAVCLGESDHICVQTLNLLTLASHVCACTCLVYEMTTSHTHRQQKGDTKQLQKV